MGKGIAEASAERHATRFSAGLPMAKCVEEFGGMNEVALYHEVAGGEGRDRVVILHGLLGNGRNWQRIVRLLEPDYRVHTLDLRNHGRSPEAEPMNYAAMAADVRSFLEASGSERVHLIGHSMGGKVAMTVACRFPHLVRTLVVVDIAPKTYAPRWQREFAAMRALEVRTMQTRQEAEAALAPAVPDWAFRKFLLTNLERRAEGGFRWALNLSLLEAALPELFGHPLSAEESYGGPTLFIRGEHSNYIADGDIQRIRDHFAAGRLEMIADAGHNVHFDQPEAFLDRVKEFWEDAPARE